MVLFPNPDAHDLRQQRKPTMVERAGKSHSHGSLEVRQRRPLSSLLGGPNP
jgi:hypothetical protein